MKIKFFISFLILIGLISWFSFLLVQKIDLTTADLGRHLKNGELVFKNFDFIRTNLYSYIYPDYLTINHHWGSGVIFFIVYKIGGFIGLSLFYLIVSLITFLLFFRLAQKNSNFLITVLFSILLIPLITARKEIRPEIFTYLFSALFFWILWHNYRLTQTEHGLIRTGMDNFRCQSVLNQRKSVFKWILILPFLEILWVNLHIYFFLGPLLIGIFLLVNLFKSVENETKKLGTVLIFSLIATFFNPFGIKGALYPLNIFRNYGYLIVENQSIWFLEKLGFIANPNFFIFKISLLILAVSFIFVLIFNRRKFSIILLILGVIFSAMACLAIRNFTIFGFFALPIIAYNIKNGLATKIKLPNFSWIIFILVVLIFIVVNYHSAIVSQWYNFGFGLMPANNQSADFFKKENIQGPIFNNYDIGSYLIYHLFPSEKVFVDNRPEAYPTEFFKEIYIPLQESESVWREEYRRYNFNVIFFSHRDATPWAQQFLINRIQDPSWAPVFVDPYAIIFLKRNEANQSIIEKYEIPKEYFRIVKFK